MNPENVYGSMVFSSDRCFIWGLLIEHRLCERLDDEILSSIAITIMMLPAFAFLICHNLVFLDSLQ